MATLAQHVPAVAAAERAFSPAVASPRFSWRFIAAELLFIAGLFALCATLLALRMAVVPNPVMPRDFAFAAFGVSAIAAIAAFVGTARLRRAY